MEKWTEERVNRLIDMWGRWSPSEIGDRINGVKFLTAEVNAKAAELGLPAYVPKKSTRYREKNRIKVRELPDGMIELATGHVCSRESYNLILNATS